MGMILLLSSKLIKEALLVYMELGENQQQLAVVHIDSQSFLCRRRPHSCEDRLRNSDVHVLCLS